MTLNSNTMCYFHNSMDCYIHTYVPVGCRVSYNHTPTIVPSKMTSIQDFFLEGGKCALFYVPLHSILNNSFIHMKAMPLLYTLSYAMTVISSKPVEPHTIGNIHTCVCRGISSPGQTLQGVLRWPCPHQTVARGWRRW